MKPTRRLWVSAAVAGAVLAGGLTAAAAAAAGPAGRVPHGPRPAGPAAGSGATAGPAVVSRELTADPEQVARYWTPERMERAEPLPMPAATAE